MKYRKKPVVIEAIQWTGFNIKEAKSFVGDALVIDFFAINKPDEEIYEFAEIKIKTLEGEMRVDEDDYIIKGVKGEFYPCKPDVFKQTYEAVE